MTHWMYAQTPFGGIVYTFNPQNSEYGGPDSIVLRAWGCGTLTEEAALKVNFEGDIVPDADAIKNEEHRLNEAAAGIPLRRGFIRQDPPLVVNGKRYHGTLTVTFYPTDIADLGPGRTHFAGRVIPSLDGLSDSARRKLEEWFSVNRASLIEGERALIVAANRAQDVARRADRTAEEARTALALATENARDAATASRAAADALHTFRILARVDKLAETTTTAVNQIGA